MARKCCFIAMSPSIIRLLFVQLGLVGRMGAIIGPILIGSLLGMNLPAHFNFIAVVLPVLITAIAVGLIMHEDESEKLKSGSPAAAKA